MMRKAMPPWLSCLAGVMLLASGSGLASAATVTPQERPELQVSPDILYLEKTGSETSITRSISVRAPGGPNGVVSFTAAASTTAGGNWLTVTPGSGSTPASLTVTAAIGSLAAGSYIGSVKITPSTQGASPVTVGVVLRIPSTGGNTGSLIVRPSALTFSMTQGGSNPDSKTLDISLPTGSTTPTWTVTTSGGAWLQAKPPSGSGNSTITVSVLGSGLTAGQYNGTVNIVSGAISVPIPVSLTVQAQSTSSSHTEVVIDPRAFNFIVLPNAPAPTSKTMRVKTNPSNANWTAAATSSGWLTVSPTSGTGAGNISISVNPAGLTTGMYEGNVAVTANGKTETARVYLRFAGSPSSQGGSGGHGSDDGRAVSIDPQVVNFTAPVNGTVTPASAQVQLTSKMTGLTYATQASTTSGGNWLTAGPASGIVPGTLTISANASGLAAGTYTGLVTVKVQGMVSEQRTITVRLQVGSTATQTQRLSLTQGTVVLPAVQGAADPAPSQVNLTAQGASSIPYAATCTVASGSNWLSVQPATGNAPSTIAVKATGTKTLSAGLYRGTCQFQSTGVVGAVPATLNVLLAIRPAAGTTPSGSGAITGVFLEPGQDFLAIGHVAFPVRVMLLRDNGTPVEDADVEVEASDSERSVSLDEVGAGIYAGLFQPLRSGPVSLTATAHVGKGTEVTFSTGGDVDSDDDDKPMAFQNGIVNSANFAPAPSPIAAGAILSLFGKGLASSALVSPGLPLARELGGLRILVGGVPAPLISVQPGTDYDQVNFQAPVEIAELNFVDVVVVRNGVASTPIGLSIAAAVPAIYTRDATGKGIAAALHANYTPITPDSPVKPGETILVYATGLGRVQGSFVSGEASGAQRVTATVQVTVDGAPADTVYAGTAPGFAGLYQVNVTIPKNTAKGAVSLVLTVNNISSGDGVTIPVN